MAPKKNAFFAFLHHYKNQEISKGKPTPSFQELSEHLKHKWNLMSTEEKNQYKILAGKFNDKKNQKVEQDFQQIINIHNSTNDYWTMKNDITKMFECYSITELLNQKFILLHINCHSHVEEQYYFPAEIAALEFTLKDGVIRRLHQLIGISNIYPRGYAGSMKQYADTFHQIHCWEEHWDDYERILLEFINFITNESKDDIHLCEGLLDLPYIFTSEKENGIDMMKIKKSLETLYSTVLPAYSEYAKSVFKIGSVEELFIQIIKKLKIHLDPRSFVLNLSIQDILEADMYGRGLGCTYHHLRDIESKCSIARILQWLSNICKYISKYTDLEIRPGKHIAALLSDGSRRVFDTENVNVPVTYDLLIGKINSSRNSSKIFEPLNSSFLTLDTNEDTNEEIDSSDDF